MNPDEARDIAAVLGIPVEEVLERRTDVGLWQQYHDRRRQGYERNRRPHDDEGPIGCRIALVAGGLAGAAAIAVVIAWLAG